MKKVIAIFLILSVLVVVLFIPGGLYDRLIGRADGTSAFLSPDSSLTVEETCIDPADVDPSFSEGSATHITLSDAGIMLSGSGAVLSEDRKTLTVTRRGTYLLRGSMEDGQIIVDAPRGWVHLVLDGINLRATDTAPIYVKNAGNVRISTTSGSVNRIADGEAYAFPTGLPKEEPFAAIYAATDLVLCGEGSLFIKGNYRDALHCKDTLILSDIALDITAREDGLVAHDAMLIQNALVTAKTGGDAIKASQPALGREGDICIYSGQFSLRAEADGLQAGRLLILDGAFDVQTKGGHIRPFDPNHSARAIKAATEVVITGGSFLLDAADDAIHGDGRLVIGGGTLALHGSNRAAVAREILVAGGVIEAKAPSRALVAERMEISGGTLLVEADENAIRVRPYINGSEDGFDLEGDTASGGQLATLLIRGGAISLSATGDGALRVRGDMTLAGGLLSVSAADNGGAPIRCDGVYRHTGGIAFSFGSTAFLPPTAAEGGVISLTANFSATRRAGETLALLDSTGNFLIATSARQNYKKFRIEAPASLLRRGESYSLLRGVSIPTLGLPTSENITGGLPYGSFAVTGEELILSDFSRG